MAYASGYSAGYAGSVAATNLVADGYATGGEEGDALRTAMIAAGTTAEGTLAMLRAYLSDDTVGEGSGRKAALGL
jgi:hypothetical protein